MAGYAICLLACIASEKADVTTCTNVMQIMIMKNLVRDNKKHYHGWKCGIIFEIQGQKPETTMCRHMSGFMEQFVWYLNKMKKYKNT